MGCDLVPQISVGSHEAADLSKKCCQASAAGGRIDCNLISQPFKAMILVLAPTLGRRVEQAEDCQDNMACKKMLINPESHPAKAFQQVNPLRGSPEELPVNHPREVNVLNLVP
jgi:hypothetical protein